MKRRFLQFFAPDDTTPAGGTSPAATVAIPAEASPTGKDIPQAPAREPKVPEIVQPQPVKQKGIVDVKKALGLPEKPSTLLKAESDRVKEAAKGSTIIPVPKIKTKVEKPAEPAEAPAATKESETPTTAAATAPEPPVKVKIGDAEMTPDEIAAKIAELEAKAKAPEPKPEPVAEPAKPAAKTLTPEERAAEEKRLDDEYLAKASEKYTLPEADLDVLLSGGEPAVKLFAKLRAQDALETRRWVEETMNPILRDLEPVLEMHAQVAKYQEEARFFTANEDLRPHQKTVRAVEAALRKHYPEQYAAMTETQRHAEVATNVKAILAEFQPAAAPTTPAPAAVSPEPPKPAPAAPAPAKPRPAPATGQVGGSASPRAVNPQAAMVQRLLDAGK